ncbi:DUF1489 family protein [Sphingomonas sp. SUN039]|uniref:DUF1489 family protein n=1 Tax=Sphingomonas sp. SUN039 TaxID=2937787 RepID=UPI00216437E7|nr:DUF1489 domain-containing protein [Sphingomonas sp. SUN039]UVO55585.1 DUF1489 domain-containing protein [Sphingomonas sp. SUN039]
MLHLTKVAFGATSIDQLLGWWADRGPQARLTTRYKPKRADELVGGSLFWILKHQLVARTEILGFEEAEAGKTNIVVSTGIVRVRPIPRRAHQGWRYLENADAPRDLVSGDGADELPPHLVGDLSALGLI